MGAKDKMREDEVDLKTRNRRTSHLSIVGLWARGSWHPQMSPLVLPEMVRSHELSAALITSMWSVSGVYPHMSSKLIRTKERPRTACPCTFIGPLT